jgi:hypothetical protein
MRTTLLPLATATAAVLLASSAAAQSITPAFGWPAGSRAKLVTEVRTWVSGGGGGTSLNDSTVTRTTFAFEILPHAEGLEVVTSPGVVEKLVESSRPQTVDAAALGAVGSQIILSRSGGFVRVGNIATLKHVMDSMMGPTLNQMRQMAPAMVSNLEQSLSEQGISSSTQTSFTSQYLSMVGRSWTPGDSTATSSTIPAPFAPGVMMTIPRMLRYDGVVPCADPSKRSCWQFTARTEMTRAAMRPAMLEMLKQMGVPDSMVDQIPIPETTTTTVTQVEAGTLLPVRIETRTNGGGAGGMVSVLTGTSSVATYSWK